MTQTDLFKLRPSTLSEFVGKTAIVKSLRVGLEVSQKLKKPLEHTLFYGPPGVGKTSLAQIIANELRTNIKIVQATNIQTLPDLIGILNSLKDFDVLFIDEIHSLKLEYAEMLYSALEDNVLDLLIGKNYNSKAIRVQLPKFTLVAATTNLGALPKALEERFGYIFFIDSYTDEEIMNLIQKISESWGLKLSEEERQVVLSNSRGIPRNTKRILRRVANYQAVKNKFVLDEIIKECGFIFKGLTETEMKYLSFLEQAQNYSAGIRSIIQGTNVDESTILKKIEPFLVFKGYICKGVKGRTLTSKGQELMKEYKNLEKKIN